MVDLEAFRDHFHCSEDTDQRDIQDPLDNEDQDSDGVGAVSGAAQMAHCSAPLGSPGWNKHLVLVSEGRHSRTGWRDGNHLLNIDSEQGYRHRGRLDSLQALPVDCTEAEHLIRTDTCLHSVLWNETGDTSSVRGSPDTEKHPCCYSSPCCFFPSCKSRASQVSALTV